MCDLSGVVAVILAGGTGTRVRHLLGELPKPMAPVAGRPFLEWQVRYLARQGVRRVVLSTGYRAEAIAAHFDPQPVRGVQTICVAEPQPLGTGGGLLWATRHSGLNPQTWLVLNGDTLCCADLGRAARHLADPEISGVLLAREVEDASRYGSLALDARGCLRGFEEKRPGRGLVNAGVYLLRAALLEDFPAHTPLSLEREVFPALTARGRLLKVETMQSPFLDIGTPETLPLAAEFVRRHPEAFEWA